MLAMAWGYAGVTTESLRLLTGGLVSSVLHDASEGLHATWPQGACLPSLQGAAELSQQAACSAAAHQLWRRTYSMFVLGHQGPRGRGVRCFNS